jgi:hypothetical protein
MSQRDFKVESNKDKLFGLVRFLLVFSTVVFIACASPNHSMARTYKDLIRSLDILNGEIGARKRNKTGLRKFIENRNIPRASIPSIWPTAGWLSSRFGYRKSPFTGEVEFHRGIDIGAKRNTPVVAPADGVVSCIRWEHSPGRVLYINHGCGLVTKYAHLQKVLVQKGQYIKRRETVALVGATGRCTGPHLHYEVHLNGIPMNPLCYVSIDALKLLMERTTRVYAISTLCPRSLQVATYEISKPNGTFYTAQDVTEGVIIGRRDGPADRADYYRVQATGRTMILRLELSLKKRTSRFKMTILDADQRTIGDDLGGNGPTRTLPVTPQATHYIKVDLTHAPIGTPRYQLHVGFS